MKTLSILSEITSLVQISMYSALKKKEMSKTGEVGNGIPVSVFFVV